MVGAMISVHTNSDTTIHINCIVSKVVSLQFHLDRLPHKFHTCTPLPVEFPRPINII